MAVPQEPSTPPAKLLRVEQTPEPTKQRGITQQPTVAVPP